MKLILGQFTQHDARALQEAWESAQRYQQHIIMPYYGDREVQVIDLPRRRVPRKNISIQAHCG